MGAIVFEKLFLRIGYIWEESLGEEIELGE